jgi:hypothetical protein
MSDAKSKSYQTDLVYVTILGLTVIMISWCGLQHELWSSEMIFELQDANEAHRIFTTTELKDRQAIIVDLFLFTEHINAMQNNDTKLGEFYKNAFSPELKQSFDEWVKTDPMNNSSAKTPFTMLAYQSKLESKKAIEFLQSFDEKSKNANDMRITASNYVFFTTIFSGVLFLVGLGKVHPSKKLERILLIMGIVLFSVTTAIVFATLPIIISHTV